MGIVYTLVFTVMLILNSIELSSQFECLPNGAPIPGVPRGGSSSSSFYRQHPATSSLPPASHHSPIRSSSSAEPPLYSWSNSPSASSLPPVSPHIPIRSSSPAEAPLRSRTRSPPASPLSPASPNFPIRSSSPAEPPIRSRSRSPASSFPPTSSHSSIRSSPAKPLRSRSRSPPAWRITPSARLPSYDIFGYGLDQLQFIRLTPVKNPNRVFELRRYTFPAGKEIEIHIGRNIYKPISTEEQIVLSTHDGDVFAILDSTNVLAGIHKYNPRIRRKSRAKINMESGTSTPLTPNEIKEVPVGPNRSISFNFIVECKPQSSTPPIQCKKYTKL